MIKDEIWEIDGLYWVLGALIISVAAMLITLIIHRSETKQMELALSYGCTQVYIPDAQKLYWTNCTKNLQSK